MSRIKPTVDFIHAWQHPDEIADEVEEELRFHVQKRTQANIEEGMTPDEARVAAQAKLRRLRASQSRLR
jgi:hypothetical protein